MTQGFGDHLFFFIRTFARYIPTLKDDHKIMKSLFNEFASATTEDWKQRLAQDLKGIPFEALHTTDRNGLIIHPFYHIDEAIKAEPVFTHPDWEIVGKIRVSDVAAANKQALHELNGGATGLHFVVAQLIDFELLLQDISVPHILLQFTLLSEQAVILAALRNYLAVKEYELSTLNLFVGVDYIATALTEAHSADEQTCLDLIRQTKHICIDATIYQQSGATSTYEIGCLLAQLNEYLHLLQQDDIQRISITVATDTQFFEQIAKLRALRKVVKFLLRQYDRQPEVYLQVITSDIYRSPFDAYSNLLRDTIAGMAAVIGGCNSLYIPPFDKDKNPENSFSNRLSRNQQLIFKEESYLNKVADIGAGSYYLEALTAQLANKGWEIFQELELEGGLLAAVEKGIVPQQISLQAHQLVDAYTSGKKVLIGVNKFPNSQDMPEPKPNTTIVSKGLQPLKLSSALI